MRHGAWLIVAALAGCGAGEGWVEGGEESLAEPFSDRPEAPTRQSVIEEVGSLPFRNVAWDYPVQTSGVYRITLGAEHVYIETVDNHLRALDRFTGEVRWDYTIPIEMPLDWEPVEALGVGEAVLQAERDLEQAEKAVEQEMKVGSVSEEQRKKIEEAQKKRNEARERVYSERVNDFVFLTSKGWLWCLDRRTGREKWFRKLPFIPSGRPAATRNRVFFPSADHSRIVSLRVDEKGAIEVEHSMEHDRFNQISGAVCATGPLAVVSTMRGSVHAFWADKNKRHWDYETRFPFKAPPYYYRLQRQELHWNEKAEGGRKLELAPRSYELIFIGGMDHAFHCLDANGGFKIWKGHLPAEVEDPAIACGETVYVRTVNGYLHAFDVMPQHLDKDGVPTGAVENPQARWSYPMARRFLMRSKTGVYIEDQYGSVVKLHEQSGKVYGVYPLTTIAFTLTNPMDDRFYCATADGHVFCLTETREMDITTPAELIRKDYPQPRRNKPDEPIGGP